MKGQQEQQSMLKQREIKVIFVGDTSVGKTSIANRYMTNKFNIKTVPTTGSAFFRKQIVVDNVSVRFLIWDTAGQENYRSMVTMYYRNAAVALVVFDLTRSSTFEPIQSWVDEIRNQNTRETDIYIIGNKVDKDDRQVDRQQGEEYAAKIGAEYFECSAMDGTGVEEIFNHIAKKQLLQNPPEANATIKRIVDGKESKGGCC